MEYGHGGEGRQADADERRRRMVREQMLARGIRNERVLAALRNVPRHRFVPPGERLHAYEDRPLPIGEGQTISQPYIVALMTQSLNLRGPEKVLEIGAGSGYQTAILARLCAHVVALERHAALAERARATLERLDVGNVSLHVTDGSRGWPEDAPYDAILVAAAAPGVPPALWEQLAPGGRLVLPLGDERQQRLQLLTKTRSGAAAARDLGPVAFVPLVGRAGFGLPADLGDGDF